MDFIPHETECKIFAFLRDVGCCISCSLRFVGTRSLETFHEPESNAVKLKYIVENDNGAVKEEAACSACLGILQDVTQAIAIKKIIGAIEEGFYDSKTFNCALTLPVCLFLRERSIQVAVNEKFQLSDTQSTSLRLRTQSIKEIWKSRVLSQVEQAVGKHLVAAPNPSPLLVEISYSYINDDSEMKSFSRSSSKKNQSLKFSRKTMENTLIGMTNETFQEYYKVPPSKPEAFVEVEQVGLIHSGIFLGGRYAKFSRELSQTPWFINGEKKMETSVQDLICGPMIELTKADCSGCVRICHIATSTNINYNYDSSTAVKFLSSGREDVDVRNIHSGRPFAVELVNPRVTLLSDEQLSGVVTKINESTNLVQITTKLKILDGSDLKKLKEGENEKTKIYRALCTMKNTSKAVVDLEKLAGLKDLEITQKTPLRVLHRRPLVPRIRTIHAMKSRWLRPDEIRKLRERVLKTGATDTSHIDNLFILDVKTQAGTYVKEFVHGDFGRTKPNLCDILGGEFDIAALDVTGINLDWP